jgi:NADPH:quinone reductase-like Zn-dependent oxidoreductase
VADDAVASLLLRGITTHMLLKYVRPVTAGDTLLVHAAAGGLGLVIVQWAKRLGARVLGTVSSPAKARLAMDHGLDAPIFYRDEDFAAAALRLTEGRGVDYAIDGIGGQTLRDTLGCVRPYGMVASVGQVAGDSGPIDLSLLGPARSVALSRPGCCASWPIRRSTAKGRRPRWPNCRRACGPPSRRCCRWRKQPRPMS